METASRKSAQASCQRLILPKEKVEIPDVFLRRLDAHRAAPEALIPPMQPPETTTDFVARCSAVKNNSEPNVLVLPRSETELEDEFKSRMAIAKVCPSLVLPRNKSETVACFKTRMAQQARSKATIFPRAKGESDDGFSKRVACQAACSSTIHPFDVERESEERYLIRLHAHAELPTTQIAPGQDDVLDEFSSELKKREAYKVDAGALNAQVAAEQRAAAEEEEKRRAADAAEAEERRKQAAKERKRIDAHDDEALEPASMSKEEAEAKVQELMARRKAEAEARAKAEAEARLRPASFDEQAIQLSEIGFSQLKKLLQERGVPEKALFSCSNKVALKELAEAHESCKLCFA